MGTNTRVIGKMVSGIPRVFMNTPMGMFMMVIGSLIKSRALAFWKWPLGTSTRASGLTERRMVQVLLINNVGLYLFANGDVYDGHFINGNRQGPGIYTWVDKSYYNGEW